MDNMLEKLIGMSDRDIGEARLRSFSGHPQELKSRSNLGGLTAEEISRAVPRNPGDNPMMPPNGMPPGAGAMPPPGAPPMQPPGAPPGQPPLNVGQMPVDPQALAAMLMAQGGGQPGMPPGGPPPGPPMMGPNGPVQGGMPPGGMPPRY